jgi:hypothetical protein
LEPREDRAKLRKTSTIIECIRSASCRKACQELGWWLTPVILATQETEIRRITIGSQPGQTVPRDSYLEKPFTKIGLVRWFKVKALSSSPSTTK